LRLQSEKLGFEVDFPFQLVLLHPGDAWLCSATLRVLNGEPRSAALADLLGWRAPLPPAVLAAQLLALGEAHPLVLDAAVGQALAGAVPRIYTLLTASLTGGEAFTAAERAAKDAPVVWVGTGFARAAAVAFAGALDLAPYLHVLPADLTCFRPLLTALGVRDAFSAEDYVGLLHRLAADEGRSALDASRLDLALWVLGTLADCPPGAWRGAGLSSSIRGNDSPEGSHSLPVPDAAGVLTPAAELRFNDAPWLAAPDGVRLAHPKLPQSTAEAVGVRSLRLALLAESSEDIGMEQLHGSAQAFGQHEAGLYKRR
jgi:sacsin